MLDAKSSILPLLLFLAAILGATSVAAGAVGRHIIAAEAGELALQRWQSAVTYHQMHSLALLVLCALTPMLPRSLGVTALLWLVGTLVFCGSLYALALGGASFWSKVTPYGGMSFIAGWLWLGGLAIWIKLRG